VALILVLVASLLCAPLAVKAQPPAKVPRIGYLIVSPLADPPSAEREAFRQGLRELGYIEGQSINIVYRSANWNRELLPDLAEQLVSLKVDVIVVVPGAIDAARQATQTIPIVVAGVADPVEAGLVTSLARPGGNITGTAFAPGEVAGKQLALLKETLPKISRVAVLRVPDAEAQPRAWREIQAAARKLGMTVQSVDVADPKDFPGAFSAMARKRPDALLTLLSVLTSAYRPIIVEFATKHRLPTMFGHRADVEAGGLMSYAPSAADLFRRTAGYVDRILKGSKPGDLPIERPAKFELTVNMKTARALGLTLPQSVLYQADTVIDQ
jgi:putative tryptophan/tyrosine transport system substrate-binding protein